MELVSELRRRIRADFRQGIYVLFGVLGLLILLPLAFFRLAQQQIGHGVLDLVLVVGIAFSVAYAWRGGNLDRLGIIVATALSLGVGTAIALSGAGVFWVYPVVLVNAFIVPMRLSGLLAFALIALLVWHWDQLEAIGQPVAALGALAANAIFATAFAQASGLRRAQLERLSTLDPLTGVENRRALESEVQIAISAYQRDARPIALAMIDLDHFKKVNDVHGHEVGDQVLRDFARIAESAVRRTDRLFRFGGEEFVLLMPATDDLGLELAMSHLRLKIREQLRANGEAVTVSIGGAILRRNESRDDWLSRADAALYRAKAGGRNRLEIDLDP